MELKNGKSKVPLVFYLCMDYFRDNESEKMTVEGLLRIGTTNEKLRELELHMSVGNYNYINAVESPHVVSNYLKKVLFEMKYPLVPFSLYPEYGQLGKYEGEDRIIQI